MQKQDIENGVLMLLQSQGANPGGAPNWALISGSVLNQASVGYWIDRATEKLLSDIGDLELLSFTTTFPSIVNTSSYAIPPTAPTVSTTLGTSVTFSMLGSAQVITPASMTNINVGTGLVIDYGLATQESIFVTAVTGSTFTAQFVQTHANTATVQSIVCPALRMVQRVFYTPFGQSYTREESPGVTLVSWQEFQRRNATGYLRQFSFGTEPEVCAVSPDRKTLNFYPGASITGDAITLVYAPIPTAGTQLPLMVNETDTLPLPADVMQALMPLAAAPLAARLREWGLRAELQLMYSNPADPAHPGELERIKTNYARSSAGQSLRFTTAAEQYVGPYGDGWGS